MSTYRKDDSRLTSIIIPTRDSSEMLSSCLESIYEKTVIQNFEIIIVNNHSKEEVTYSLFEELSHKENFTIINYNHRFNYSAINNFAVKRARGDILLFLNNDIEVISPGWLEEMVSYAVKPEVGAVGALLLYPDATIQHAGVVLGIGGVAGHAYLHEKFENFKKDKQAFRVQEYPAVTGACMAVERKKFEEVGGLDEKHLSIAFNDIDLCLKLLEHGYKNMFTPNAQLCHYESVSRGYEDTLLKKLRFRREIHYMQRKWGAMISRYGNNPPQ